MTGLCRRLTAFVGAWALVVAASSCRKGDARPRGVGTRSGAHAPTILIVTTPHPAQGPAPLGVTIDACKSAGAEGARLDYAFDFGDGKKASPAYCQQLHTYFQVGTYSGQVCGSDGESNACEPFVITVR
jgi:hypothetical protein